MLSPLYTRFNRSPFEASTPISLEGFSIETDSAMPRHKSEEIRLALTLARSSNDQRRCCAPTMYPVPLEWEWYRFHS